MERISAIALGSLGVFLAAIVLYGYDPLPTAEFDWRRASAWGPVALIAVGLAAFVVFLITGLITFLNRGSAPPPEDRGPP